MAHPPPSPPARAKFQIALTVCERCQQGWQEGAGAQIPVDDAAVERALCDAQHIGSIDGSAPDRAYQDIAPSVVRFVWRRDGGRCRVDGCRSSRGLELHHVIHRADGGTHDASNLVLCCSSCHQAHHAGLLTISGTAENLVIRRRDEAPLAAGAPPTRNAASANRMPTPRPGATGAHVGAANHLNSDRDNGTVGHPDLATQMPTPRPGATGAHVGAANRLNSDRDNGTVGHADLATQMPTPRPAATGAHADAANHLNSDRDNGTVGHADLANRIAAPCPGATGARVGAPDHPRSDRGNGTVGHADLANRMPAPRPAATGAHVGASGQATSNAVAEPVRRVDAAPMESHRMHGTERRAHADHGMDAIMNAPLESDATGDTASNQDARAHVGAASRLDAAVLRAQAKAALTSLGWKPTIAHAAVTAAAAAAQGAEVTLERLIFESLRRCPTPGA